MNKMTIILLAAAVVVSVTAQSCNRSDKHLRAAYISQGLALASSIKIKVSAYYEDQGKWPSSNDHIGLPAADQFVNDAISGLTISEGGVITIKFTERSGVKNGIIKLTPDISKPHMGIAWLCTTPSFRDIASWAPQCEFRN